LADENNTVSAAGFVDRRRRCMSDEVFRECGTACESVCGRRRDFMCTSQCVPECQCRDGYVRASAEPRAPCVSVEQCHALSHLKCRKHEHANACGAHCEMTCENYRDRSHICPAICDSKPACVCDDGYVRDVRTGRCHRPTNCRRPMRHAREAEPAYLRVPHYEQCVVSHPVGTITVLCLPADKPKACSNDSWNRLNEPKPLLLSCDDHPTLKHDDHHDDKHDDHHDDDDKHHS